MRFYTKSLSRAVLCCGLVWALVLACAPQSSATEVGSAPTKLRLAYFEGGHYNSFPHVLAAFARQLVEQGLMTVDLDAVDNLRHSRQVWSYLARHARSEVVEFLEDAHYSGDWNEEKRAANKAHLSRRIAAQDDVDVVLALGTSAGRDVTSADTGRAALFVLESTDPVGAGIVASVPDSGRDKVYAQIQVDREERQVKLFHTIFKFKKLGVFYEDSHEERIASALPYLERAAEALGFELLHCTWPVGLDAEGAFVRMRQCLRDLSRDADALYLPDAISDYHSRMGDLLQPIIQHRRPSFSQSGMDETRFGVLMGLSNTGYMCQSKALVEGLQQVARGVSPRELPQALSCPTGLSINTKMAGLIGWTPPLEVLVAVDVFYQEVPKATAR